MARQITNKSAYIECRGVKPGVTAVMLSLAGARCEVTNRWCTALSRPDVKELVALADAKFEHSIQNSVT